MCRLQQELELQQHSLQLLSERMAGSEGHQLAQALAETEAALQEAQAQTAAAADKKKEMVALAKVRLDLCSHMAVVDTGCAGELKGGGGGTGGAARGMGISRSEGNTAGDSGSSSRQEEGLAATLMIHRPTSEIGRTSGCIHQHMSTSSTPTPTPSCVSPRVQSLEREITDFSKDRDKRVKAAQAKLKAAKQVRTQEGCEPTHSLLEGGDGICAWILVCVRDCTCAQQQAASWCSIYVGCRWQGVTDSGAAL
jgi:hypothetical protein